MNTEKNRYMNEYRKAKLKRVPLDLKLEEYQEVKEAAEAFGESVNGYIKKAVTDKIKADTGQDIDL